MEKSINLIVQSEDNNLRIDVFVSKKEDSLRLIDKFNIKYQNIYDENGDLVNDFNVLGFPTTLFFDKNHKLSKKWTGYLDEENLIEQLKKINN